MRCEHNADMIPREQIVNEWDTKLCPVDMTYQIIKTARRNSCGQSVMCRDGIAQYDAIIGDILEGEGQSEDIKLMQDIADAIILSDDCELAVKAAKLIKKTLEVNQDDWKSHILTKKCLKNRKNIVRNVPARNIDKNGDIIIDADIAIIGGGMSGLTASVAAAELGASVVVLEKGGTVGGAANMGMGFFAVESKYQNMQMISHTVDGLFKEFMEYTHWRVNAPLVKKLFRQSASTIEWIEGMGVEFLGAFKYFKDSNQTWHIVKTPGSNKPAERCASIMIKAMKQYADDMGVLFEFYTPANEILTDDKGKASGVEATDEKGRKVIVKSKAVIVSSGGFGDNVEMIQDKLGLTWAKDLYSFRIPGLKGDGINMVEKVGGATDPSIIEVTYTTPGVTDVFKTISETMRQPNLMVNLKGSRIIDETIMNNTTFTGNAISMQPKRKAFTIITDSILDEYRNQGRLDYITVHHNIQNVNNWGKELKAYFEGEASDTAGLKELQIAMSEEKQFFAGDSLEELCEKTGIDYAGLKETIAEYNKMAGQYDEGFNKHPKYMRELKEGGRYYAAAHYICGYGTLAGIRTDANLRVVNYSWQPVSGLYGCGTDVCSIFGDSYNFYMPGSTMGFAINSGRLAGMNAAGEILGNN